MIDLHDDVYIGGRWRRSKSERRSPVFNPATGEIWANVPDGNTEDIDNAVAAARSAFPGWAATPPEERAGMLRALRK